MPNWTMNTVTLKGIGSNKAFYDDEGNFDFNKIIPEPESAEECISKYGKRYIDDGTKHLQHNRTDDWFDWYGWHCDFWGTKWNACDTCVVSDDVVSFDTAWAAPEPIFEALSKMYPNETLLIEASYEEGYDVTMKYTKGRLIYSDKREREED